MITADKVKEVAKALGADLCGIAPVDRLRNAPEGFRPEDVYQATRSIIVLACRVPDGPLHASSQIPYTILEAVVVSKINRISFDLSLIIEGGGSKAVLIPSFPYDYWDEENLEGKGILSLKHLGYYAGLGLIGRNTLLCNEKYGNLIKLGAILTDAELEADEVQSGELCAENCQLCIDSCPVEAIGDSRVSQKKCRPNSEIKNGRGAEIYICNVCRAICPNRNGFR